MWTAIASCWSLLLGLALLMLGHGLQGTLLGVRASMEGFATETTGLIMTGYFAGYAFGSTIVPRFVRHVGHVRVFAALASLASVAVLAHMVFVEPIPWLLMRLLTGFCFAGLYIVAESWINDVATNETRGKLLSVYMVVVMGGVSGSQLLLNIANPQGIELFVLISVLVSISLVPILLSASPAPAFATPSPIGLAELYRASPLGVVGSFATGLLQGSVFGMGAVFATNAGLTLQQVSWFMTALYLGAVLAQWPMGLLSDRLDRRKVILAASAASALGALAAVASGHASIYALLALALLYGGLSMPLYSLFIAYTNDYLSTEQRVAATARLVLLGGLGAAIGPVTCSLAMGQLGARGFFTFLATVHIIVAIFGLYRMTRRDAPPLDEQVSYPTLSPRTTSVMAAMATRALRDRRDRRRARQRVSQ